MAKRKALASLLLTTNMATRASGRKTRKMAEAHISIRMGRGTRADGSRTKSRGKAYTNIEMEMSMMEFGKMIEGKEKEL